MKSSLLRLALIGIYCKNSNTALAQQSPTSQLTTNLLSNSAQQSPTSRLTTNWLSSYSSRVLSKELLMACSSILLHIWYILSSHRNVSNIFALNIVLDDDPCMSRKNCTASPSNCLIYIVGFIPQHVSSLDSRLFSISSQRSHSMNWINMVIRNTTEHLILHIDPLLLENSTLLKSLGSPIYNSSYTVRSSS